MSDGNNSIGILFNRETLKIPELLEAAAGAMGKASKLGASAMSPAFWGSSAKSTVDMVKDLVDVPLADILVGAWKAHQQFAKYTDAKLYPPDKVSCVALMSHHIKSSHKPYIELTLDGAPAGQIDFEIALDILVEPGVLVIQDGKFKRIEAGRCQVTGSLACEGKTIVERSSREFSWPAGISFGEGIPIEVV